MLWYGEDVVLGGATYGKGSVLLDLLGLEGLVISFLLALLLTLKLVGDGALVLW
jgi:hypothetical protein